MKRSPLLLLGLALAFVAGVTLSGKTFQLASAQEAPESKPASRPATQPSTEGAAMSSAKGMIRHVVLFKFKETATEANIRQVEEAFGELPAKIPEVKGYEWGTDNSPEGLAKGYTHCFLLTFENEEGRAAYLPHPAHREFVDLMRPYVDEVLVIDYVAKE